MRRILGFLCVFAFTAFVGITAHAASVPGATAVTTQGRIPSMPAGIGGMVGGNMGANSSYNVPSDCGCGTCPCPSGCTPGATQSCTTQSGQVGTQTCTSNRTWGACIVSSYTVDECMNALLACINSGALSGGISDLYDANVRNSVISGSGICRSIIDKCVANLDVYNNSSDVWIDFNSRVIQPQYYNFVLRKTGLTPNQSESTCLLIDKNTRGRSFQSVGPQDLINNNRNDGSRGNYARWDAKSGECLVRIAAYNKDDLITNSWLFGIAGDEKPAEVWKSAGTSFSCNKDLFNFSLMKKTATVAVVGAGATVLGTGIAAVASIPEQESNTGIFDCNNPNHRKELRQAIRDNNLEGALNLYISDESESDDTSSFDEMVNDSGTVSNKSPKIKPSDTSMSDSACKNIVDLQEVLQEIKGDPCYVNASSFSLILKVDGNGNSVSKTTDNNGPVCENTKWASILLNTSRRCTDSKDCVENKITKAEVDRLSSNLSKISDVLRNGGKEMNKIVRNSLIAAGAGAGATGLTTAITAFVEKNNINCRIGNDMERVAMGKSGSIDSLKNFYVKWNLRLPDTVGPSPTVVVTNCASWKSACAAIKDMEQCTGVALHYKPIGATSTTVVYNACAVNKNICTENVPVAASYGACQPGLTPTPNPGIIIGTENETVAY